MEGPGSMDEDVERGGGTVDRRSLPPRSSEVACNVAQQPEKLETMMVAESLPVEERVIGGNEGSQVCAEGVGEGGGCKVRVQAREGCAKGTGERRVGEGGGQGMEYCAERVNQQGVGEVGGQGREECAEDAGGEVVGENGGQKRDIGAGGSNAEMEQNGAGREPGLPSEEDEEMEDFEGEEGEDDEEEGLEEDRGRCSMTPSSEPPERPSSRLNSAPHTSEFENGGFYDDEDDEDDEDEANEDEDDDDSEANAQLPLKKQKTLASLTTSSCPSPSAPVTDLSTTAKNSLPPTSTSAAASTSSSKKSKKKSNNVRRKPASRKGKKKGKTATANNHAPPEEKVLIAPIPRFPDRSDDSPDAIICLSKIYKAEKVELSEDRLTAGSTKGYRMVRATRGVIDGAWYFEISVLRLGETGHTRLGWTTEKGDLQAPVGYDGNSYGYRDIGGMKIHKALREKYGDDGYAEGDVIGCYINLPEGEAYAPKPPHLVWYKGQKYMYPADGKDDPPKVIPGSEIAFFKNGECQGTAFTDLFGGRYYPAASMYTLPNQPNCEVRFNFGPTFQRFPKDFGGRPIPRPMTEAPYHGYIAKVEGPAENGTDEKQSNGVSS